MNHIEQFRQFCQGFSRHPSQHSLLNALNVVDNFMQSGMTLFGRVQRIAPAIIDGRLSLCPSEKFQIVDDGSDGGFIKCRPLGNFLL